MINLLETVVTAHPSNLAGALVSIATCLGAVLWVSLLFSWDDPGGTRASRDRDVLRGLFDDRRRNRPTDDR